MLRSMTTPHFDHAEKQKGIFPWKDALLLRSVARRHSAGTLVNLWPSQASAYRPRAALVVRWSTISTIISVHAVNLLILNLTSGGRPLNGAIHPPPTPGDVQWIFRALETPEGIAASDTVGVVAEETGHNCKLATCVPACFAVQPAVARQCRTC